MWAFGTKLNQAAIGPSDFDPVRLSNPDEIDNFATNVTIDWSLFDPAQSWIPWRQAKRQHVVARLAAERVRQQLIMRAATAYTGLLLVREQLRVVDQALETARAHLKLASNRFESGFVVKSDLLRAQLRIAELTQSRLQTSSDLSVAHGNLNLAMGVAVDKRFELVSPLGSGQAILDPLDKWVSIALARRPDLRAMALLSETARDEVRKSKSAHLPSVHLQGNYEINTEDFGAASGNYTVGAVVRLNLFSGQRLSAKTKEARAALGQRQAMKEALADGIRVETRQALYQAQSAWHRIQVTEQAIAQAEESLRIVRNRYESGLFTIVNLLDAEVVLQQSRMNHSKALYDYRTATAQLALAAGTIDTDFR